MVSAVLQIYRYTFFFGSPAIDIWVMSMAPTHIHLAASIPNATGSD